MKIATFNINGIKARLPALLDWLNETKPDVAMLQEIKSVLVNPVNISADLTCWIKIMFQP